MDCSVNPYPVKKLGSLGLKRSIIPDEHMVKVVTYLDKESHLVAAANALQKGLTTDEFIRRLIWEAISK